MPSHSTTDTEESSNRGLPMRAFAPLRRVSFLKSSKQDASSMVSYAASCGPCRSMRFLSHGLKLPEAYQQVPSQVVGCAPSFSTVGLYTTMGMLPSPSHQEFKVGKARLHTMIWDSSDYAMRQVQPEVRTETKW